MIFLFAAVGSALPFVREWKSDVLHLFVAFGAGVFLGAVFFHLLPDVKNSNGAFAFVLAGFLVILIFEQLTFRHHDEDCGPDCPHRHDVVGLAAFLGLIIHSLTAGVALGVGMAGNSMLGFVMFLAIIGHKSVEAFSLATVLKLSDFPIKRSVNLLAVYALMTPLGAVAAYLMMERMNHASMGIPTSLAAGTFLYVATMDLLPEAFHVKGRRLGSVVSMLLGLAAMYAISLAGA